MFNGNVNISFSDVMDDLFKWVNPKTGKVSPMIADDIHEIIMKNSDVSPTTDTSKCQRALGGYKKQ